MSLEQQSSPGHRLDIFKGKLNERYLYYRTCLQLALYTGGVIGVSVLGALSIDEILPQLFSNGVTIAYDNGYAGGSSDLYLLDPNRAISLLIPRAEGRNAGLAQWSADGNSLAYLSARSGTPYELHIRSDYTKDEELLVQLRGKNPTFCWFPNGMVASASKINMNDGSGTMIEIIDPKSGPVSEIPIQNFIPTSNIACSPEKLVALTGGDGYQNSLLMVDVDSNNPQPDKFPVNKFVGYLMSFNATGEQLVILGLSSLSPVQFGVYSFSQKEKEFQELDANSSGFFPEWTNENTVIYLNSDSALESVSTDSLTRTIIPLPGLQNMGIYYIDVQDNQIYLSYQQNSSDHHTLARITDQNRIDNLLETNSNLLYFAVQPRPSTR